MSSDLRTIVCPLVKSLCLATLALLGPVACVSIPEVQPWEKGNLARPEMRFDQDRLDVGHREHTYSSKEASAGGAGAAAGGCGCN